MNIDKDKLKSFTELPDDALWSEVRKIAATHGVKLPEGTPEHTELERLRALCADASKINLLQAMRIVNDVKRRGKL